MKYIAYTRKSTDETNNQVLSIPTQKRIVDEMIINGSLQVVETIEEKRSAKISGNRPLFTQMISKIRDGEIQGIIVAHADRLARNERELADLLELFDQGLLLEIRIKDRVYKNYNDFHDIARDLIEAAHFSRNLSARVKEGNESKLLRGEYLNRAPIGYKNHDKKIILDNNYAPYIRLIFETYASGSYSLKNLTKFINDRGMRTRDTGNYIQKSTIHGILTNPTYYGVIWAHGKLYKGIHEPIISYELFSIVQDVLNGKNIPKKQKHEFLYRGYIRCGICEASYTASIKKGKYKYYYCTNSKGICSAHKHYLDESKLKDITNSLFTPFQTLDCDMAQLALEAYINDLKNQSDTTSKMRELITKQINDITEELKTLLDVLLRKTISDEEYKLKQIDLQNKKTQLELQLANLKPLEPDTTRTKLELIKKRAISLSNMFLDGDDEVKSDILKSTLWNFSLIGENIASYRYKKLWELLEKGAKSADFKVMYPVPDSDRRFTG